MDFSRFIDARTRTTIGVILRVILVVFSLIGTPHLLRLLRTPPTVSDLYPVWFGSRELLLNHRNPYSAETSREIQTAFYGAPLGPGDHPDQECCFAYPVYASLFLAPIVRSNFYNLQQPAMLFLALISAISVVCWHTVARGKPLQLILIVPLALASPPMMQGLDARQSALLVAALLSVSAVLADRRHFALCGVALALATIRPQMCLLPIAWMLLWAIHGWAERKNLIIGFVSAMVFLIGFGELVLPGWISYFLAQLRFYRHFAGSSIPELIYGREVGLALSAILIAALLLLMWRRRTAENFLPTLAFVLATEVFIMPGLKSLLNLVLLIPGIFLLLSKFPVTAARETVRLNEFS